LLPRRDFGAQQVAGGDVRHLQVFLQAGACVPLPEPGAPNKTNRIQHS
jgi:hypothetical protein